MFSGTQPSQVPLFAHYSSSDLALNCDLAWNALGMNPRTMSPTSLSQVRFLALTMGLMALQEQEERCHTELVVRSWSLWKLTVTLAKRDLWRWVRMLLVE
jgi:hypothetical protein